MDIFQDFKLRRYLFLTVLVVFLSAFFHGLWLFELLPWPVVYSDVMAFWHRASAPGFPYLDKLMEYPVLTGIFVQLAGVFGSRSGYYIFNSFFLILGSAAIT